MVALVDVLDLLGGGRGGHGGDVRRLCSGRGLRPGDQPEGVPPLELTGERTLPDVPEENYWYRRHVAVYEWIAERVRRAAGGGPRQRGGLRVRPAREAGRRRDRGGRQPRGLRARAGALPPRQPAASSAAWSRTSTSRATPSSSCRRSSTSTSRRGCSSGSPRIAPVAYISTPNRLTLAPPGAEKSDNPWHLREYDAGQYRELLEPHFDRVEILGLFHARKLRAHELAIRAGWDRVHPALRITKPFYDRFIPAISARDFRLRNRSGTDSRRSPAAATLRGRDAVPRTPLPAGHGHRDRTAPMGDLAIVLH